MFESDYGNAFSKVDGLVLSMPELRHNDNPSDFIDGNVGGRDFKDCELINKDFMLFV